MTLNPNIGSLYFFCNFQLRRTFQEWLSPKLLEIDPDNLRMDFFSIERTFLAIWHSNSWVQAVFHTDASNLGTPSGRIIILLYDVNWFFSGGRIDDVARNVNFTQIPCLE